MSAASVPEGLVVAVADERWPRVEQPILNALAAAGGKAMNGHELATITGIQPPDLMYALRSLREDDFISGSLLEVNEEDYPVAADGIRLRPKGLRQAGLWPTDDLGTAFVAALERAIAQEPDEEQRTKLQGVVSAAKAVGGMALNAAIANAVGIGKARLGLH